MYEIRERIHTEWYMRRKLYRSDREVTDADFVDYTPHRPRARVQIVLLVGLGVVMVLLWLVSLVPQPTPVSVAPPAQTTTAPAPSDPRPKMSQTPQQPNDFVATYRAALARCRADWNSFGL